MHLLESKILPIELLPQKAQLWLELIQFRHMNCHCQDIMLAIASIMSDDSMPNSDKAHHLAEYAKYYDKVDQTTIYNYVSKYAKFSEKRWTK